MGRNRRTWLSRMALLALLASAPGCGEELGPVPFPTTRVAGRVSEGPQPIRGGWIEFLPVDGTVGDLRSAPIGRDGSFDADKVAIGLNQIGLADAPSGAILAPRFPTFRSPIRRVIPAGQSTPLNIDLVEEAIRRRQAP